MYGKSPARFDVAERKLAVAPPPDTSMIVPQQESLEIKDWIRTSRPVIEGKALPLEGNETSRSLAVHPVGDRFVLGADFSLYAFNSHGAPLSPLRSWRGLGSQHHRRRPACRRGLCRWNYPLAPNVGRR